MTRKFILATTALALSAGVASAQAVAPPPAVAPPVYDYAPGSTMKSGTAPAPGPTTNSGYDACAGPYDEVGYSSRIRTVQQQQYKVKEEHH